VFFSSFGSIDKVKSVVELSPLKVFTIFAFPVTTPPILYAITVVPFAGAVSKDKVVPLTLKALLF